MGWLLILSGLLFKLGAAPFHVWIPDIYEGAPTIITAYLSIVPKIGILGIVMKLFINISYEYIDLITFSGLLSIFIGAIGGLNQTRFKRLIGYSAIGHMGFILLGLSMSSVKGLSASIIYITVYIIMSINIFGVILTCNRYLIGSYGSLSSNNPIIAITLAICLLSMAGIPFLGGFLGKYLVFMAGVEQQAYFIMLTALVGTVISSFYYVRIIKIMYFRENFSGEIHKNLFDVINSSNYLSLNKALLLGITTYLIITLLIYPNPLILISLDNISSLII